VRIIEFKEMIQALHKKGFRVIMDVVYNHTFDLDTSLQKTMPYYHYRIDEKGDLSDGSACGNDIASEMPMTEKYIIDSVLYWAEEYHIDGFRFDLMGLLTVDLMNKIQKAQSRWNAFHATVLMAVGVLYGQVNGIFTGGLSSVLDNAPTYATFFEMAGQVARPDGAVVAGVPEVYLVSISLGAVLCGAITYIGNGPNFMVKSVAESDGVEMPSFGGYVGRSMKHLVPVIAAMVLLFIAPGVLWKVLGGVLTVGLLALDARLLSRSRRLALADQSEDADD